MANRERAAPSRIVAAGVVLAALHFWHCPQVTSGPGSGCVQSQPDPVGRFLPTLSSGANVLALRVDENVSGVTTTATYVREYVAPAAGPFVTLPELAIDQCQCVRDVDGQRCDADAGTTTAIQCGSPPRACMNQPQPCQPIELRGVGAHAPPCRGPGDCPPTCVPDQGTAECGDGGEICHATPIGGLCSRPIFLTYAADAGTYVGDTPLSRAGVPGGTALRFVLEPTPSVAGVQDPVRCPTAQTQIDVAMVPTTSLLSPTDGASQSRAESLFVSWSRTGAQFALIQLHGHRGAEARTIACRPTDLMQADERATFEIKPSLLGMLDPGASTLELLRLNASSLSQVTLVDSVVVYTTSTRAVSLNLR